MSGNSTVAELPQALSLRQNFAWTLAGNILYAACQWGMLVAIAKLGTPAMVGQFSLGLAVAAPVFMFTNLQLRAVEATDARHEFGFGHYLALRLLGTSLALVAILAVTMIAGFRRETMLVVFGVALAKAAESISDVLYGLWQKRERLDKISIAMTGRGVASLAALAIVLYFTREIVAAVFALAVVWCTWLLTYECGVARAMLHAASGDYFRPAWQADRLKMLVHLSLPLGMVMLLLSLNANIPRYFVEHYLGEAALGYFSALAYVIVAGSTVMNALGQAATPRLARYFQENKHAFARLLLKMVALAGMLGLAAIVVAVLGGKIVLRLLYREDYARFSGVFTWLMVAGAISYVASMLGYGMTAARYFNAQLPLFLLATLAAVLGCFLLVPTLGLMGAAYGVLLGALVTLFGSALINAMALRNPHSGDAA